MSSPSHDEYALLTDEELAARHLDGDRQSFNILTERYTVPLYRFAYRFTGSQPDAEDVVQETFLRMYKHLPRVRLTEPLKPWIYHICTNLCRNAAKKKRSISFSQLEKQEGTDREFDVEDDSKPLPPELLQSASDRERVRRAIDQLPPKYRAVIVLYYFENFPYEEIAHTLKLPVNTVRTHLKRAKEHLFRSLSTSS